MTNTSTRDIIIKLKEVKEERHLNIADIERLVDENGDHISRSSVSRVFADGSEDTSFRYTETIRPIANALLDIGNVEESDSMDVSAMKSLLVYKMEYIEELEQKIKDLEMDIANEKNKYNDKLEKVREQYDRQIEFMNNQIDLKDKRMDQLLEAVFKKDAQHKELLELILSCPARKGQDCMSGQ